MTYATKKQLSQANEYVLCLHVAQDKIMLVPIMHINFLSEA